MMVHFENGAWSIPILKTAMHFQYWAHQRKDDLDFDREVIYSIAWSLVGGAGGLNIE